MKVLKFGGTSVGSVENMRAVMQLITDGNQKLVVLSAMSGTTNSLVEIANYLKKKNKDGARQVISLLEQKFYSFFDQPQALRREFVSIRKQPCAMRIGHSCRMLPEPRRKKIQAKASRQ